MSSTFNILMYSHDTYGMGHIRRTMAIASHLLDDNVNILILTGSPIAGRFDFPQGIDFVRIPGMIKQTNSLYVPHSIKVDPEHAMNIRQSIITATAKAFKPMMFIVDKAPMGLKNEVIPTLNWLREECPNARTVLGLRDIMDDAESTIDDWTRKNVYGVLDELYTDIWVYGDKDIYDPAVEYNIPANIRPKITYTGYIPRLVPNPRALRKTIKEKNLNGKKQTVLVTPGGGGDGFAVLDNFLTMLENNPAPSYRTVMVAGPFMPSEQRDELATRAKKVNARFFSFFTRMERLVGAADLVVSMGGYNTVCEIMSQKKPSLIIPRSTPRLEQTIRAELFYKRGLLDYIPWSKLTPDALKTHVDALLADSTSIQNSMDQFAMTGLEVMRERFAMIQGESCS